MSRRFILASNSPRRRELVGLLGFEFERLSPDVDETPLPDEPPADYTLRVSAAKARAAAQQIEGGAVIISADTTVADGNQILGKPLDDAEARAMLEQLRGRVHQVYTAISLYDTTRQQLAQDLAVTDVHMRPYSEAEIAAYVASGDPHDKAGSYAIQNRAFHPVERINGCYTNVVGLPLCHLTRTLARLGLAVEVDVPTACQQANAIVCEVYPTIL